MDYYSMKRKELQALCKKHNIPANSANSVLADKLSQLLNKPTLRQRPCIKSAVEATDESEPAVSRRQAKKVRFSSTNELVEYELRSGKKEKDVVTETKSRRKSVAKKVAKPVVDNINTVELTDDDVQIPVRVTRSRVQGKADDVIPVNEKKQSRRAVKDVSKETDIVKELESNLGKVTRSKAHTLAKDDGVQLVENKQNKRAVKNVEKGGDSVDGTTVGRVRVTRSKAQTLVEDVIGVNLNPQVKKTNARKVVNDVENVEPSKEIMDIPVRVTRSRGQTLTDDVANMAVVTQAEKKITKRETKGSDMNNNLSKVASENNQELSRRISLRTRGVEIASEDVSEKLGNGKRKKRSEESQHHADMESRQSRRNKAKVEDSTALNPSVNEVEMVVEKKVTRSKAALEMKSSEGNNKSRAKNKVEEPKKVNRRKSIMQKSKGMEKPLVAKKEVVKEVEMVEVESPSIGTHKTVKKRKSIEQSGNLSMVDEGLKDEEKVTRLEKDATENEIKSVASVTRSHKSKKQRGNSVIEDNTIETPRRATRSASKSEGKTVARIMSGAIIKDNSSKRKAKLTESKLNDLDKLADKSNTEEAPVSKSENLELDESALRLDDEGIVESTILEGDQSESPKIISGAIVKDNSSKRRVKLSESKLNDSDKPAEKSIAEGSPVSKSKSLELNEKVPEIGLTPAIEESSRRLTRSAIRSERNAAVNTTPGRVTRSGIKHRQNAGNKLFETADKEKQQSHSTHQRQPFPDAQMFSPEVIKNNNLKKKKSPLTVQKAENADTMAVPSEVSKEADDQILEQSVDLSVSESVREAAVVMENATLVSAEEASGRTHGNDQILEQSVDLPVTESVREAAIVTENVSLVSAEEAFGRTSVEVSGADIEKSPGQLAFSTAEDETNATLHLTEMPNFEDETETNLSDIKKTPFSMAEESVREAAIVTENVSLVSAEEAFGRTSVEVSGADIEKSPGQLAFSTAEDETNATLHLTEMPNFEDETETNLSDIKKTPFSMAEESVREAAIVTENVSLVSAEEAFGRTSVEVSGADIEKSPGQLAFSTAEDETNATLHLTEMPNFEDETETNLSDIKKTPFSMAEESVREAAIVTENVSLVSAEEAFGRTSVEVSGADIGKSPGQLAFSTAEDETNATLHLTEMPNFEDETETNLSDIKNTPFSMAEVAQTMPDIQDQNQEVYVKSATFSEAQVGIAVNLEKSVVKEMESTTKRLQTDLMVEEPAGSILDVDISPEVITKGSNGDADDNCDSTGPSASLEQSYDKSKSKEMEASLEPATIEDADQLIADEGSNDQLEKESEQNMLTFIDPLQSPSAEKQEVADNDARNDDEFVSKEEYDAEANGDDPLNQSAGENVLQGIVMDENDIKDNTVVTQDSFAEQNELPIGKNTNFTDNEVDDIKELKSEEMPSTDNDLSSQIPILNKSDDEDGMVNAIKEFETDLMPSTVGNVLQDTNVEGVNDNKEYESNSKLLNDDDDDFDLTVGAEPISEPSTTNDDDFDLTVGDEPISEPSTTNDDDFDLTVGAEPISEPSTTNDDDAFKSHLNQSAGDDLVSKDDVEDDGINVLNEVELGSEPSNVKNSLKVSVSGNVVDSECVVDEKTDGLNGESEQEPLTSNDGVDVLNELERGSEPSNVKNSLQVSVSGNVVDSEFVVDLKIDGMNGEAEEEPLTSNDNPVMAEPVVAQNENMPMELEVLFGSSDKESEPVLKLDVSDSVGRSDSPKSATNENGIMDSILDANKYAVSKTLDDIDGVENAKGVIDTCRSEQKSKENCSNHGVDEENIGTPEKPTIEEASPIVNTQEKPTVDDSGSDRFTEDIGVHGTPTTEESLPVTDKKKEFDDTFSDPPTFFKDDDITKQEETQQKTTGVDLGNHNFGIDEYREPDSANKCDDLPADIIKDDRGSEIEGSARASSSVDKSFSSAAELANSVTYLEKASTSLADGKLNQDICIMKSNVNADVSDDYFDWSVEDSSLKELFKTPTTNRSSNVKDNEEDAVGFYAVEDSSLKELFKTPTTNRNINVKDNEDDAVGFTFPDDRSCDDMEMTGNRAHNFDHQWESEPFDDKTQDTATQGSENHNFDHQWESEPFDDKTQDTATQGPENAINFAEFSPNDFCDGSNDNMFIEKEKEKEKEKKDKPN